MDRTEIRDLVVSWIVISVAFSIAFSGLSVLDYAGSGKLPLAAFLQFIPIALIVTGTGFILHELAHKYSAIHYGHQAEFRAWPNGLIFAIVLPIIAGFVFAAPGATYVHGENIDDRKNAIISLVGPLTNIAIGALFLIALIALGGSTQGFWSQTAWVGMQVNLFLALFNMLPIYPLDGSKVWAWKKSVWAIVFLPLLWVLFF